MYFFFFLRKVLSAKPVALAENFARFLLILKIFPLPGLYLFSSSSCFPPLLCFAKTPMSWKSCQLPAVFPWLLHPGFFFFPCPVLLCLQGVLVLLPVQLCVLLCKWGWTCVHFGASVKFGYVLPDLLVQKPSFIWGWFFLMSICVTAISLYFYSLL